MKDTNEYTIEKIEATESKEKQKDYGKQVIKELEYIIKEV